MSETVHYKGTLRKVEKLEGETLEQQCKRLLGDKELPSYFDSYQEYLADQFYKEMVTYKDDVYQVVDKKDVDPDYDIFDANLKENGDIAFDVRYYNGGCSFDEAIDEAMKKVEAQKADKIYKITHWDNSLYQLYIKTNATVEQFEDVIDEVKQKDDYGDGDIIPKLHEKGYTGIDVTPDHVTSLSF